MVALVAERDAALVSLRVELDKSTVKVMENGDISTKGERPFYRDPNIMLALKSEFRRVEAATERVLEDSAALEEINVEAAMLKVKLHLGKVRNEIILMFVPSGNVGQVDQDDGSSEEIADALSEAQKLEVERSHTARSQLLTAPDETDVVDVNMDSSHSSVVEVPGDDGDEPMVGDAPSEVATVVLVPRVTQKTAVHLVPREAR